MSIFCGNQLWIKNFGGSGYEEFKSVIETSDDGLVAVGYSKSTDISGLTALSTDSYYDAIIVKFDSSGNQLWATNFGGTSNDYFESVVEKNNGDIVVIGYSSSIDIKGLLNLGASDAIIVKFGEGIDIKSESISQVLDTYIIPENNLKLSLSTNSITFNDFSCAEKIEKLDVLKLTISSSLPYNITSSIVSDIIGLNYGEKVDNSIISMRVAPLDSYKSFSASNSSLLILENQALGEDIVHNIDIKLDGEKINRVDVYKTILKFEVQQM